MFGASLSQAQEKKWVCAKKKKKSGIHSERDNMTMLYTAISQQ